MDSDTFDPSNSIFIGVVILCEETIRSLVAYMQASIISCIGCNNQSCNYLISKIKCNFFQNFSEITCVGSGITQDCHLVSDEGMSVDLKAVC